MIKQLLIGPPGCGKTKYARDFAKALPPLEGEPAVAVAWMYVGTLGDDRIDSAPFSVPFRAPHHTVSSAGLVGTGGRRIRPGEASLATGGMLYLDELPEFSGQAIAELGRVLRNGDQIHRIVDPRGVLPPEYLRIPAAPAALFASTNACACGCEGA